MADLHKCNELNKYIQDNKRYEIEIEKYNNNWELYIDDSCDYRDGISKTIKIIYCPYCGQKLK